MGAALDHPFAAYPMVEEAEATGRVAACYSAALESMPFVPSVFKSLAVCPSYLVLAWDQVSHALHEDALAEAASRLAAASRQSDRSPVDDDEVRQALADFVDPLARMLVVSAGLLCALDGRLHGRPASELAPGVGDVSPSRPVPTQWEAGADQLFGEIRQALDTPIVNSIWRALAGQDLLERAWASLRPDVGSIGTAAAALQRSALTAAEDLPWPVVASPEALDRAGIADAAPGMAAVLDAYIKTLARVLALVAPAAGR